MGMLRVLVARMKRHTKNLFGDMRPLEPKTIVRKVTRSAFWHSRSWGLGKPRDIPSTFVVHIGTEDWAGYYHAHTAEISHRLENLIKHDIKEHSFIKLQMTGDPHVILREDAEIAQGKTLVDVSFGEVNEPQSVGAIGQVDSYYQPTEPIWDMSDDEDKPTSPIPPDTPSIPTNTPAVPQPIWSRWCTDTPNTPANTPALNILTGKEEGSDTELKIEQRIPAYLVKPNGKRYTVLHGETIGVRRGYSSSFTPDVVLDGDSYKHVSRKQGQFRFSAGVWFFKQCGRNCTKIQDGSRTYLLDNGNEREVHDGNIIIFANGEPLTFRPQK